MAELAVNQAATQITKKLLGVCIVLAFALARGRYGDPRATPREDLKAVDTVLAKMRKKWGRILKNQGTRVRS